MFLFFLSESAMMGRQVYLLVSQPRPAGLVSQSAQIEMLAGESTRIIRYVG